MNIRVNTIDPTSTSTQTLIVGFFEDAKALPRALQTFDHHTNKNLTGTLKAEGITGKHGQTTLIHLPEGISAKTVLIVGLGKKNELTNERVRRAVGSAVNKARAYRVKNAVLVFDTLRSKAATLRDVAQAAAEGALLASYQFMKYKTEEQKKANEAAMDTLTFVAETTSEARQMREGVERGAAIAQGVMFARDLVNEPANEIRPRTLADAAQKIARQPNMSVQIMDQKKARELGMGSFLAVASGSAQEAYFIHVAYKPKKKGLKKVAICGKGITFDSGGLSLKPGVHMDNMKMDMAGGAMILGLFTQLNILKPNVEVHGVIVATENMPGCGAMRPGDVVTAYNGKTIEIANTDAEGRLVLADALAWAEDVVKPDVIYDVATLTGSAISALGQQVAAIMGSDQKAIDAIMQAGETAGEQYWQLPMPEEYKPLLESKVADVSNLPAVYWAGCIVGGMFLRTFVNNTPWAHIDFAGPAWADKQVYSYEPYGATGFGVRTFVEYLSRF